MRKPTYPTRVRRLSADEAYGILDALGCSDDPVALLRVPPKTDPAVATAALDLRLRDERHAALWAIADLFGDEPATQVRIAFYGGPQCRRMEGSLQDMVHDRLRRTP